MCGITGVVGRPPDDPQTIARMTSKLGHRGPDDSGVWRSPRAHIGHTRLSIIDLSAAGHQPMHLDDLTLTYNGEIYNFLGRVGIRFFWLRSLVPWNGLGTTPGGLSRALKDGYSRLNSGRQLGGDLEVH